MGPTSAERPLSAVPTGADSEGSGARAKDEKEDEEQDSDDPEDLRDDSDMQAPGVRNRGTGIPILRLGTYVRPQELLLLPSLRYSDDKDFEYNSGELGFSPAVDGLEGHYQASQGAVLLAYGVNDRLAVEFGAEFKDAKLEKAPDDPSNAPQEVKQSGLGRVTVGVDWRLLAESGDRPEIVTFAQAYIPHNRNDLLTGTADWLINAGFSAARGFSWGTTTLRVGAAFDTSSPSVTDWGEVTFEYLRQISPKVTVLGALQMLEGDEGSLIVQLQWQPNSDFAVQFSNSVGLTTRAIDWAPQLAFVIRIR